VGCLARGGGGQVGVVGGGALVAVSESVNLIFAGDVNNL